MDALPRRCTRGLWSGGLVILLLALVITYYVWMTSGTGLSIESSSHFIISSVLQRNNNNRSNSLLSSVFPSDNQPHVDVMESLPVPNQIPPDVHYLWCGQRWFEFRHYLSVRSVIRSIRTDKIEIHCEFEPEIDRVYYNQWLDQLKREYPWLLVSPMDGKLTRFCSERDTDLRVEMIARLLSVDGGMYISENTLILDRSVFVDRSLDVILALDPGTTDGYILLRKNVLANSSFLKVWRSKETRFQRKHRTCCRVSHVYHSPDVITRSSCMIVTGEQFSHSQFYPMNVWEDVADPFAKVVRTIFYGTDEVLRPVPSYEELVPNIGHMVWLNGGEMKYLFYLSVLSMLYVANVETVYIHGDKEPAGRYWQEIQTMKQTKDRVKFITRTPPFQIYQGDIDATYWALMSDVIRCDLMIRYGGIYTDTDALWVKPLSYEDRGYDAVASYDWVDWAWPFPDTVNFGISYGKRNAPFWRLFKESMRTLHNDVHGFTGVLNPYKILEKYPQLLRVDRHLQVICYHSKCHPTWVDDYHNMSKDHTNMNSIPNWRKDVNAFHWTHPDPMELTSRSMLLTSTGIFAEMGRNVLQRAGLL